MSNEETVVQKVVEHDSPAPGVVMPIADRDLTRDTAQFYGVTTSPSHWFFPYPSGGKHRSKTAKGFFAEKGTQGLFGQDKFPAGGKYITITEGEFDAMAAFQMKGSKYPVVSIRNGASGALKDCKDAYEWLSTFESVIICFDADEPGQKAARQVAELFGAKAKVVKLNRHKDANEYLMQGDNKAFVEAWWSAEQYTPDGIISGTSLWDLVNAEPAKAAVMYPFEGLNKLTYGVRTGELVMFTAGSGLGKSQVLRETIWQIIQKTEDNVGLLFLEEGLQKTAVSLMSLAVDKPLHLPSTETTAEEYRKAYEDTLGTGRMYFFNHFGSTSIDNIVNRVRYMAKALGCKFIFLDHISIVVSDQQYGDERKALDEIMTRLRQLVQETNIALFCVSHLKRPEGRGHEEGAATSMNQLRGSGAIGQLSDIVIGLERNAQDNDPVVRNTTRIRVLKNRFCGLTGPACEALYSLDTGRMTEKQEEAL